MFAIKDIQISSPIIVAPMAGISNGAFRELCFEFGAGLVYSEMVSDKAIYYKNDRTMKMIEVDDSFHPVSLQLFGSQIDTMVHAAKVLDKNTNCDIIDINMGCPVNKVIKSGAGSALMKEEDKAVEIVKAIIENVDKPVTVKMRIGFDMSSINCLSLAKKLEAVGVSAIAIHGRSRSQMYEGKANWDYIKLLKENLNIPVIGNGDVKTVEDFKRMLEYTKCDGVMIGRALVGNPFLIKEIDNYLNGKEKIEVDYNDRLAYCLKHARKLIELHGERNGMAQMRGLAPHYITGLYSSTVYKNKMTSIRSLQDLEKILDEYKIVLEQNDMMKRDGKK